MLAIISLLVVVVLSLLVVRVATVALTLTGLSQQLARFQARSAFTGSGFTTTESEKVVQHPVRRRIIMILMLLGNAGIVTAVSSLILSFTTTNPESGLTGTVGFRLTALAAGLIALWLVAYSRWVDRWLSRTITLALKKWTDLEVRDYAGLLHLSGGYAVVEMLVQEGDWMAGRQLIDLKLSDEGVLVLGIEKSDGSYFGAPRGKTKLEVDDTVLLYGPRDILQKLDERVAGSSGNWEHHVAVDQQRQIEKHERELQENAEHPATTNMDSSATLAEANKGEN